jgi:hypothetical protein
MTKNKAESLCWCCIYYEHVREKTVPGTFHFPTHPYCKKGHMNPDFGCEDFKTTRELVANRIGSLESQIKLLEERLDSKQK